MNKIIKSTIYYSLGMAFLLVTGCKKDFQNPNAATSTQVLSSAKGLMGTAIGIHRTYSLNVAPGTADANGFITKEVMLLNAGNTSELQLTREGTAMYGTNALLGNLWPTSTNCIYYHNILSMC